MKLCSQDLPKLSTGIALGGSGWIGIPIQYRPAEFISLDLGVYGRAAHVDVFESKWYFGPAADFGISLFFSDRFKQKKNRRVLNGIYLKAGLGLHELKEYSAGLGWVRELHLKDKSGKYLQIQIGSSVRHRTETHINTRYPPGHQEQTQEWNSPTIYTKISWFFVNNTLTKR
ncbi:MAG: hypothetical protein HN352_14140 [Bacteroidetes bacterium]|jgi:hypothetical protein|nr:hypothetical protein [Bacteroidota bacterium]MBT3748317.1 hypothetical protein [Bacteroidota bacterium]MBT4398379.1 hypothetical protein [Bacteroidota bacterium]MBT4411356.1 hypothetical protein [Bacteroidota bacterium]MBT7091621.1 hypothetical protein [Bacteroidota bacterium]